jgi:dihydrofolate reductase/diadenosine tetraphosphate (Ap4A) HIT family hydrolase
MTVSLVVARSRNGCIGRNGDLPWRLPGDLRRFRELTTGGTVVMGRRTYESLPPAFRPLPDRRNVVLSRDPEFRPPGVDVVGDLEQALREDCFVIGGGSVYAQALPLADRIYETLVDSDVEGDTFFPALDAGWACAEESAPVAENGYAFTFRRLERRPALYDLAAARSPAQRERMRRLQEDGICIFCQTEHQPEPVEHVGEHWFVTRNHYPYAGTSAHYLIVARRHVTAFDELPDAAGAELWAIRRALKREHAMHATAFVERSGDMRLNGGSIAHLHTHFVALRPDPEKTVRFRVSAHGRE